MAFLMYLIATKSPVNLPYLMIHQMAIAAKHSKFVVPYGIALTRLF